MSTHTDQNTEEQVAAHYTRSDIATRILAALDLEGAAPGSVPIEALFGVDQLHHGGVGLTEAMARAAGIRSGMTVLDAGSGIGGAARFLADLLDSTVAAIDLSEAFVQTARALDALTGLEHRITHRQGSVTALPYPDAAFDAVWSQNVTMNVPDKAAMFAEAFRVLKPGGVYVLSHLGQHDGTDIDYPLPWAMTQETSFATPPDAFLAALAEAGFTGVTDHAAGAPPPPPPTGGSGQPDDSPAMGDDMPLRRANVAKAVQDGHIATMLVTARRP